MRGLEARTRRLLAPLHELEPEPPEPPERSAAREVRVVAAILANTRPSAFERRRPWPARLAMAGTAMALAAGVTFYFRTLAPAGPSPAGPPDSLPRARVTELRGRVTVTGTDGRSSPANSGQALSAADRLVVPARAAASVVLPSGAAMRLGAGTDIALGGAEGGSDQEQLKLVLGTIALEVPPLGPKRSLAVVTPHATVSVVGTRFSVTVVPATLTRGFRTCVSVDAGQVRVNGAGEARLLRPGQRWSSDGVRCDEGGPAPSQGAAVAEIPQAPELLSPTPRGSSPPSAAQSSLPAPKPNQDRAGQPSALAGDEGNRPIAGASPELTEDEGGVPSAGVGSAERPLPTAAFGVSTLERQNQLFVAAVSARRAGDHARALVLLDQLLTEHPGSPLAAQARRERDAIRKERR